MEKIILYYKFVPLADTEAIRLWQSSLAEKLNLKGRIIISDHGINGTLGGDIKDLKAYIKNTKSFSSFKGTVFKWADGKRDDFPKLSVKVRSEVVTFNAREEIKVDSSGIVGGGKHLKPKQVHALVNKHGKEVVFFDGRNAYEADVGRFKNAVVTDISNTRDFIKEIEKPKYRQLKDKHVITYCTGGIRCEILSVLMKNRGFKNVYQIDGGIIKYGEQYGDDGLWQGALYNFDGRMATKFSNKAKDIGSCVHCGDKTSDFKNCVNKACNKLIISCSNCTEQKACTKACAKLVTQTA